MTKIHLGGAASSPAYVQNGSYCFDDMTAMPTYPIAPPPVPPPPPPLPGFLMAIDFEEPLFQQTDAMPNIKEGAAGRLMLFTQAPGAAKPPGRYGLFAANVEPFYEACHAQLHFKSFIPPPDVREHRLPPMAACAPAHYNTLHL